MGNVNFTKLKTVLNNPNSKITNAEDSSICLMEYLEYISNFSIEARKMKEDELAMLIISMENWKNRRNRTSYIQKEGEDKIKVGDIFFCDLGIGYKPEFCYAHPIVILEMVGDMVLVVPTSTSPNNIEKAYHPIDNTDGAKYMRRVSLADGFKKDCAIILNNARVISGGRLIKKMGKVSTKLVLEEIQDTVFKLLCSKKANQFENLEKDHKNLQFEYDILKEKNKNLINEYNNLKDDFERLNTENNQLREKELAKNID